MINEGQIQERIKARLPKAIREVEEGKVMTIDEARKKIFGKGKKIKAQQYIKEYCDSGSGYDDRGDHLNASSVDVFTAEWRVFLR